MGSIQNLVKWVRDRTSKKKKSATARDAEKSSERDLPSSNRSSLYGFHKKEQVCENTLYSKSSAGPNHGGHTVTTRASPFRLYNDSPAHVYEEIPGSMVTGSMVTGSTVPAELRKDETGNRMNYDIKNLDFTEAKEVGPYLVVPIRKQKIGGKDKLGLIRTKNLVDMVQSTENVLDSQTVLHDTTKSCSNRNYRSKLDSYRHRRDGNGNTISDTLHIFPRSQNTREVVAEIHHSVADSAFDSSSSSSPEEYIHCKKCKRPHGIYKEDFMEHYESDDNVFDEPDLIKDSQVKGQGQNQGQGLLGQHRLEFNGGEHEDMEGVSDSDESVYGIREQIYSTTEELQNYETYTCNQCVSKALQAYQHTTNSCDKDETYSKKDDPKGKGKVPYWKKYVSMGSVRKVLFHHKDEEQKSSPAIDIPSAISYSTVSTRLSPNTQLLLDGRHYKTLPIDLVTPVKSSGTKKPFGYDKLELSKSKTGPRSQYSTAPQHQNQPNQSQTASQTEFLVPDDSLLPKWHVGARGSQDFKPRNASCSDIIDDSGKHNQTQKSKTVSISDECEYMSMAHGSSPRDDSSFNLSTASESSPSGIAMEKKKAKILKSISKSRSKENLITMYQVGGGGGQKQRSISMTDNDIYNCDAETKRKIHLLTRNKLSSTWNGPRPPPKGIQHVLSRHSTLPHSFSLCPKKDVFHFNVNSPLQKSQFTRSSDSLLLPQQLSSKDFHTLSRNSGFPGPLYLRQGGIHGKMLRKKRFASSSDCLLSSTITEEPSSTYGSAEKLSCRATHLPRGRSLSYDANAQTYTNAAAIAQNQGCSYQRRHNPILSDLMRVNNDRQTLMLV